jgi:glucokinase
VFELLAELNEKSELRSFSFDELSAKMISDAALRGDKIALRAFDFTGRVLGQKLADSIVHTNPEAIILFGGLALAGDLIFHPTKKYMEDNLPGIFKNKVKLLPSKLTKGNTAVLGAAGLIWNELDKRNN